MSQNTFSYSLADNYRIFHGKLNDKPLGPGQPGEVKPGDNIFKWYIKDEPRREYTIFIDSPPDAFGSIPRVTGKSGASRGVFPFKGPSNES